MFVKKQPVHSVLYFSRYHRAPWLVIMYVYKQKGDASIEDIMGEMCLGQFSHWGMQVHCLH